MLSEEELSDAMLLIWANKQDLPNAMPMTEIADRLELHGIRNRKWYLQPASAITGSGLYEGLDWLWEQRMSSHPSPYHGLPPQQWSPAVHGSTSREFKRGVVSVVVSLTISGRILPFGAVHPMCGLMFHQLGELEATGSLWGGHGADHDTPRSKCVIL